MMRLKLKGANLLLLALLFIGGAIRFTHIGYRSLWADEAWVATLATGPFKNVTIGSLGELGHPLPPGFAIAIWLWAHITNASSEAMLRLWPALISMATILIAYAFVKMLWSKNAAIFAAATATGWEIMIEYAQELKQYSGDVFFAFLLLILNEWFSSQPRIRRGLVIAVASFAIIIYSFQTASIVTAIYLFMGFMLVLSPKFRANALKPYLASIIILGFFAVACWMFVLRSQFAIGSSKGAWGWSPCMIAYAGVSALGELSGSAVNVLARPYGITQLAVSIFGLFLWPKVVRSRVLIYFALTLLSGILLSAMGLQPLCHRQVLFLLPFLVLGMTGILGFIAEKLEFERVGTFAIVFALFLAAPNIERYVFAPHKLKAEEAREVVAKLEQMCRKGDVLYVYYGGVYAFNYYGRGVECETVLGSSHRYEPVRYAEEISPLIASGQRLFIFFSHANPKEAKYIIDYVSRFGELELVASDVGAAAFAFRAKSQP